MPSFRSESLGGDGEEFQRRIALMLLQRATLQNRRFKLAFEMTDAGKFDDVGLFLEQSDEWWLIQAKHAGSSAKLGREMLLPSREDDRKTGNFSLFKYLDSYCLVEDYWTHGGSRKRFVLFTNKEFDLSIAAERASDLAEIFRTSSGGEYLKLKPDEEMIESLQTFTNCNFQKIRQAIVDLFNGGEMNPVMKEYKTPLKSLFTLIEGKVRFAETISDPRLKNLYNILKKDFQNDNKNIVIMSIEKNKMEDFWTGKSRKKLLPPSIDRATVKRFFEHFLLATSQPNVDQLLVEINTDWQRWMRSWIRPDDYGRLDTTQFEQPFNIFKRSFHEWERTFSKPKVKSFLELQSGQEFLKNVERELGDYVRNCSKRSRVGNREECFINRRINYWNVRRNNDALEHKFCEYQKKVKVEDYSLQTIKDLDFVDQLYTTFRDERCFLLVAEPGMGKTTLWQYLSYYAQKRFPDSEVFLLNLNKNVKSPTGTMNDVMDVFKEDLSQSRLEVLKDKNQEILLFLDAFDELNSGNIKELLKILGKLLARDKLKIFISSRQSAKELLEISLGIKAMNLEQFNEDDQIKFLAKVWRVSAANCSRFGIFAGNLLSKFHRDIKRHKYDITGLPLMIKMLGEIYQETFEKFSNENISNELDKVLTVHELFHHFIAKCIEMAISKKVDHISLKEMMAKKYQKDYQVLSTVSLIPKELMSVILKSDAQLRKEKPNISKTIVDMQEESLLVEIVAGSPQFTHTSYGEYFCAQYLYEFVESLNHRSFVGKFEKFLKNSEMTRVFFLTLIDSTNSWNHLKFLEKMTHQVAFWACQSDCANVITYLKKVFNYVKIRECDTERSMLHVAIEYNAEKTLKILLESGVEIHCRDKNHSTPLHYACGNGSLEIVETLLEKGAKIDSIDSSKNTALHKAAENGFVNVVRSLISHSAKIDCLNFAGDTPLMLAVQKNNAGVVEFLLSKGANINHKNNFGFSILHSALLFENQDLAKELMQNQTIAVDAQDCHGRTPLHIAAQCEMLDVAALLVVNGANINATDRYSNSVLHYACRYGSFEIVKHLVNQGAKINPKHKTGKTPLHVAAQKGHLEIVELLATKGAVLTACDNCNESVLHAATISGNRELVRYLLQQPTVPIDARNRAGLTPLYLAAQAGQGEIFNLLKSSGANTSIVDRHGKLAGFYLQRNGDEDVVYQPTEGASGVDQRRYQTPVQRGGKPAGVRAIHSVNNTEQDNTLYQVGAFLVVLIVGLILPEMRSRDK